MPTGASPEIYLTFDDGPHPGITPWVLDQLAAHGARATFFCIGKNVQEHPDVFARILAEGHSVGNHTQNHLNGWKTPNESYLQNIHTASGLIQSRLFRPPYGRIRLSQVRKLTAADPSWRIVMWSVLTGDFDINLTPEDCLQQTLPALNPGSIVVFHDSEKASSRMMHTLPAVLQFCTANNWLMKAIPQS